MIARVAAWLAVSAMVCVCAAATAAPRQTARPETRSPGKPTAPMTVDFALTAEPAPGALLEISIEVHAPNDVRDLALDARADDAQALLVAAQSPVVGKRGAWTVAVVPLTEATSYLNVTVQGTLGGETQTRSVAIPVRTLRQAAAGALPRMGEAAGAKQARDAGRAPAAGERAAERVVLLPAVETAGPAQK